MIDSKQRIVWVEWLDSTSHGGWNLPKEIEDRRGLRCESIGFVVLEDDESITVAASFSAIGSFNSPITIPKCAIQAIKEVVWSG